MADSFYRCRNSTKFTALSRSNVDGFTLKVGDGFKVLWLTHRPCLICLLQVSPCFFRKKVTVIQLVRNCFLEVEENGTLYSKHTKWQQQKLQLTEGSISLKRFAPSLHLSGKRVEWDFSITFPVLCDSCPAVRPSTKLKERKDTV